MARAKFRDDFLDPIILKVLEESPVPLNPLSINFKVNEKTKKIVSLNTIKNHLKQLSEEKKIMKKVVSNSSYYWTKRIGRWESPK